MTRPRQIDSKLSPENRVVVPTVVRRVLGVASGDRVVFVIGTDGGVRLVTPRLVAMSLWANNHGGDAGDAAADIRQLRTTDQADVAAKYERIEAAQQLDERGEEEITAALLADLGLR